MLQDSKVKIMHKAHRQDVYDGMAKKKDAHERFQDVVAFDQRARQRPMYSAGRY